MVRFVYPNVSYSGDQFIGCGRFAVFSEGFPPPPSYRLLDGLPDTVNTDALVKAGKVLARVHYHAERLIYEAEDPHDPEEDYRGDSCSLAFLLALVHRARTLTGADGKDLNVWCTGTVGFNGRPYLEAVFPKGFDVKINAFLHAGESDPLFIVPSANVLQHHESLCREGNVGIVELSRQCAEPWSVLLGRKTILKVDFDELTDLVNWLFEPVDDLTSVRSSDEAGSPGSDSHPFPAAGGGKRSTMEPAAASRLWWPFGVVLALLVVLLAVNLDSFFVFEKKHDRAGAQELFSLIHRGEIHKAEALYRSLDAEDGPTRLGLAALHLNRGDLQKAAQIRAKTQADGIPEPYAMVVDGHLQLAEGRQAEAEAAYRKALATDGMEPWEAAEGHLGLGRIYLERGELDQALAELNRASELEPAFARVYTARGLVLERQGALQEASDAFAKASSIHPEDPLNGLLALRSREKLAEELDAGRAARVDVLVAELAQAYRKGRTTEPASSDEWTSRPLHVFFLPFDASGQVAPREGEDVFLYEKIVRSFVGAKRVELVERAVIDRLLQELKLSRSEVADPETALRLGKILSARIIAAGRINRYSGELEVALRAIDTETSLIAAAASGACPLTESPKAMLESLVQDFQNRIAAAYPIRGRVAEIEGSRVRVNIGSRVGVVPGMKLLLVEEGKQSLELVVTDVQQSSCTALRTDSSSALEAGWRVEGS